MTTALLAMVDAIRQILASVEAIGNEGERDYQELIQNLTRLLQGTAATAKTETPPAPPPAPVESAPAEAVALPPTASVAAPPVELSVAPAPVAEAVPKIEAKPEHADHADHGSAAPTNYSAAQSQARTAASESSIRVDVGLLDKLMNLVGELVLARNQILQFQRHAEDAASPRPDASGST